MTTFTATYSPEDNKLRLYASARLDPETYAKIKAAGFSWAPRQELFVAPAWSPSREDLLIELAGDIGDEDTSLVDRAEQRADRFEGYSERRAADAASAKRAVAEIADGIPFGQPILVGHHSERRARKDAERIRNGMDKAVKMWRTSQYWEARAAGALAHAKYKELPSVRHRRIKGLEADRRKWAKRIEDAEKFTKDWQAVQPMTKEAALRIANYDHLHFRINGDLISAWSALDGDKIGPEEAADKAVKIHAASIAHARRWLEHLDNRLTYERAMLGESGGIVTDRFAVVVGGRVLYRGAWSPVLKVNRDPQGRINSVSLMGRGRFREIVPIERIADYQAPEEGDVEAVKAATKRPPLCNYPGDGFPTITKAQWDKIPNDYKTTVRVIAATETAGAHRVRHCMGVYAYAKDDLAADWNKRHSYGPVYISDAPRKDPPALGADDEKRKAALQAIAPQRIAPAHPPAPPREPEPAADAEFREIEKALRNGTAAPQVVAVPQLFPTPPDLARRMVELSGVRSGDCVLEPSAGTGNLARAVLDAVDTEIRAIEINADLCAQLRRAFPSYKLAAECADFLAVTDFQGCYPVVLMNPPFKDAIDIRHIEHAVTFLKPGGRLVALCANGPRQRERLKPKASYWEDLPAGTFAEQGTSVNVALLVIEKPAPQVDTTDQGPQTVIPGAERITDRALAEKRMEGAKRPPKAQRAADHGLFDTAARNQMDLFG